MSEQRIAILDASHSLLEYNASGIGSSTKDSATNNLLLQPIPQFREIVAMAVRDARSSGKFVSSKMAAIEVGVICDASGVRALSKVIHAQTLKRLRT